MPNIRKLSPAEVQAIEGKQPGQRTLVEAAYDALLQEYNVGDLVEAELESGEKRITVRNRLRAAAARRNVGLEFRRMRGDVLRFKVVEN